MDIYSKNVPYVFYLYFYICVFITHAFLWCPFGVNVLLLKQPLLPFRIHIIELKINLKITINTCRGIYSLQLTLDKETG